MSEPTVITTPDPAKEVPSIFLTYPPADNGYRISCCCGVKSTHKAPTAHEAGQLAIEKSRFRQLDGRLWCRRCFKDPSRRRVYLALEKKRKADGK